MVVKVKTQSDFGMIQTKWMFPFLHAAGPRPASNRFYTYLSIVLTFGYSDICLFSARTISVCTSLRRPNDMIEELSSRSRFRVSSSIGLLRHGVFRSDPNYHTKTYGKVCRRWINLFTVVRDTALAVWRSELSRGTPETSSTLGSGWKTNYIGPHQVASDVAHHPGPTD